MSETVLSPTTFWRVPVEKPQAAVAFLQRAGGGVMDLIAHFWERLPQTPPLLRADLHLVLAAPPPADGNTSVYVDTSDKEPRLLSGAMLYVPKAYRADVLATDEPAARGFADYISQVGRRGGGAPPAASAGGPLPEPPEPPTAEPRKADPRPAIDFLTGGAAGVDTMVRRLLPLLARKVPARQLVNVVMQLPAAAPVTRVAEVRVGRESDVPTLTRWRRQYKDERGIAFDADLEALVQSQRVFVLEEAGQVVAVAKFDLELSTLVEIGGVYTFPAHRNQGCGRRIVSDLAARIRAQGKTPTLQVDQENSSALRLYERQGWHPMGPLARVWLTNGA